MMDFIKWAIKRSWYKRRNRKKYTYSMFEKDRMF